MSELQAVANQRVLIMRGKGGRETLAKTLHSRGATVDYLELYERSLPDASEQPLQAWLHSVSAAVDDAAQRAQDPTAIVTVSSGDGLSNLIHLAGTQTAQLYRLPLVVVSERLAEFARQLGFHNLWIASSAADDAVVSCIKDHINGSDYDRQ
jgi:uroporphyrinogen-III synthase